MTLFEIQQMARRGGCYVIARGSTYILYRSGNSDRGVRVGKSESIEGIARLVKKATNNA